MSNPIRRQMMVRCARRQRRATARLQGCIRAAGLHGGGMEEWFEPLGGGQMVLAVLAGGFFWGLFLVLNFFH